MISQAVNPYAPPKTHVDSGPTPMAILTAATPRARLAAASIDALLLLPVVVGSAAFVLLRPPSADGASPPVGRGTILVLALTLLCFAATLVYQFVMLSRRGQTFGKRAMNIRVVKLDGTPPGFVHAVLLRIIVNGLPPAIPMVGRLYTLVDLLFIFRADGRCLHDLIAGTRVVQAEIRPAR